MENKHRLHWRYNVQQTLGDGGSATVYLASDILYQRLVAVKVSRNGASHALRHEFIRHFRLRHRSLVEAYDYFCDDGAEYYSMEYFPGKPLAAAFKEIAPSLSSSLIAGVLTQMAGILSFLHTRGCVHGDLKSENILWHQEKIKLLDVGASNPACRGENDTFAGTPAYAAPELLAGSGRATAASDIYSLGLLLYELITGVLPAYGQRLNPHGAWSTEIRSLISDALSEIIITMLRYDPIDRFASGERLQLALQDVTGEEHGCSICNFSHRNRNREFAQLIRLIKQGSGRTAVVLGAAGSGKTRLLKELNFVNQITGRESHYIPETRGCLAGQLHGAFRSGTWLLLDHIPPGDSCDVETTILGWGVNAVMAINPSGSGMLQWPGNRTIRLRAFTGQEYIPLVQDAFPGIESYNARHLASWLQNRAEGNLWFALTALEHLCATGMAVHLFGSWQVNWQEIFARHEMPGEVEKQLDARWNALSGASRNVLQTISAGGPVAPGQVAAASELDGFWIDGQQRLRGGFVRQFVIGKASGMLTERLTEPGTGQPENEPAAIPSHELWKLLEGKGTGRYWFDMGCVLLKDAREKGNIEAQIFYALKLMESGLLAQEDYRRMAAELVRMYRELGRWDKAAAMWKSLGAESGQGMQYFITLAKLYYNLGQMNSAIEAVNAGKLTITPVDEIGRLLAEAMEPYLRWLTTGAADAARQIEELIHRTEQTPWAPAVLPLAIENRIRMALDGGDAQTALSYLALAFQLDPAVWDAGQLPLLWSFRGIAHGGLGQFARAEEAFAKSIALLDDGQPHYKLSEIYLHLATCFRMQKKWDQAVQSLENARLSSLIAQSRFWQATVLENLAHVYCGQGRYRTAIAKYRESIASYSDAQHPEFIPLCLNAMAEIHHVLDETGTARGHIERALAICDAKGLKLETAQLMATSGIITIECGGAAPGIAVLRQAVATIDQQGQTADWDALLTGYGAALSLGDHVEAGIWRGMIDRTASQPAGRPAQAAVADGWERICRHEVQAGLDQAMAAGDALKGGGDQLAAAKAWLKAGQLAVQHITGETIPVIIRCLSKAKTEFEHLEARFYLKIANHQLLETVSLAMRETGLNFYDNWLSGLRRVADIFNARPEPQELAQRLLDVAVEVAGAERGALFLKDDDQQIVLVAHNDLDAATRADAYEFSMKSIHQSFEEKNMIFSNDAILDQAFKMRHSIKRNSIRSLICVPFTYHEGATGALYLDSRLQPGIFNQGQRSYLRSLAALMGAMLEENRMLQRLARENEHLKQLSPQTLSGIIWQSGEMDEVMARVKSIAAVEIAVLIQGETGTGKEMVARAIHDLSADRGKRFIAIDCSALPETILESELFGHAKGAFTDARTDKAGLFEAADGGTVFLDEISSASQAVQARLLRVIEEGEVRRLGDSETRKIKIRLICATNRDLDEEIGAGRFRQDLYYRIKEMIIRLPALRERPKDVSLLAEFFKNRYAQRFNKPDLNFSSDARKAMAAYPWPGNVRELKHAIKRAVLLCSGKVIRGQDLDLKWSDEKTAAASRERREILQKQELVKALKITNSNIKKTAVLLGISRSKMYRLIEKHGITVR